MIEQLSATDIANEISMLRSAFSGTVMAVEGVTDARLYGKFADRDGVRIVTAYSKDNVRRSILECSSRGDKKVMGVMDADLDRLKSRTYLPPLFISDHRDMETMIMSTSALDDVLSEYADETKQREFESQYGSIRNAVLNASYPLGLLMYVSSKYGLGLSFKDLEHRRFVSRKSLKVDLQRMIEEVFRNSMNSRISKADTLRMIYEEEEQMDDPWDAARGHDAVAVLLIGLTDIFGSYNARNLGDGQLSGALRLAFGWEPFRATQLYVKTSEWAKKSAMTLWEL